MIYPVHQAPSVDIEAGFAADCPVSSTQFRELALPVLFSVSRASFMQGQCPSRFGGCVLRLVQRSWPAVAGVSYACVPSVVVACASF